MRHFVAATSRIRNQAESRVRGKEVGSAILSTKLLRQIKEGRMVPRAAPAPMPNAPKSWYVTVLHRGADGGITKIRIRSEFDEDETPGMPQGEAPKGWTVKVSKRDNQNLIRELHITPGG
jgi:hypothetical protein